MNHFLELNKLVIQSQLDYEIKQLMFVCSYSILSCITEA